MGNVHSWDDVMRGLPGVRGFQEAKDYTLRESSILHQEGRLIGLIIYGSVARCTPTLRADMDIIAIVPDEAALLDVRNIFHSVQHRTFAPVESNVLTLEEARAPDEIFPGHTLDAAFLYHFSDSPVEGNLVGENPLNSIVPSDTHLLRILGHYLAGKKRKFRAMYVEPPGDSFYSDLRRGLELPVNLGRKVATVLARKGFPVAPTNEKEGIVTVMGRLLTDYGHGMDDFLRLLARDEEYTSVLVAALNKEIGEEEYNAFLRAIHAEVAVSASRLLHTTEDMCRGFVVEGRLTGEGYHRGKER